MGHEQPGTPTFYVYIVIVVGLVLFAGLMSGLTLGLMSLSLVDLEVLHKSGTPADQKHAGKILPVVRKQHLLLCTLLIGNALAMEALPIFLDSLVSAWGAILISVTLILLFGEIIPQSVCSRYGLAVGSAMAPIVNILLVVFFPVAYPISKLLDAILGKRRGSLFRRSELITLVDFHGDKAGKGGELTHDETTIIAGALKLTNKTAVKAMTKIEHVFALNVDDKLDMEKLRIIKATGHSRIPVFAGDKNNIMGLLLVKNLLTLPPQDETPVRNCTVREIPWVPENLPLYDILNDFQKGRSHMAVVFKNNKEKTKYASQEGRSLQRRSSRILSIDTPPSHFLGNNVEVQGGTIRSPAAAGLGSETVTVEIPDPEDSTDGGSKVGIGPKKLAQRTTTEREHGNESKMQPATIKPSDEGTQDQLFRQRTPKKRVNVGSLPGDANDKEVVGIITMEDLIEELLQEEIIDETDEYVDIHNKIKVNMQPPGGKSPVSPLSDPAPMASSVVGSNLRIIPASPRSWAPNTHNMTPANPNSSWASPSWPSRVVSLASRSNSESQRRTSS